MGWIGRAYRSSIGAKLVMAGTGILLLGFVVAHLLGNLQLFAGPEAMNGYAQALRDLGPLLWAARIGLIVVTVAHVATALRLVRQNEAARPVPYVKQATRQVKPQTRLMWTSGLVLLGYVLFHLAHLTWCLIRPDLARAEWTLADGRACHDVYSMTVRGFEVWWISAIYVAAMLFLALHLCHGVPSFFQTLGLNHPKYQRALELSGPALATLIFVGYVAIPAAVWAGRLAPAGATP